MTSSDAEIFPMTVMVADCRDGGKVRGLGRDHSRGLEFRGVDRVLQAASNETLKLPGGFVHRDHRRAAATSHLFCAAPSCGTLYTSALDCERGRLMEGACMLNVSRPLA